MAFEPQDFTVLNKSLGIGSPVPISGRTYYYDKVRFVARPFLSKQEVLDTLKFNNDENHARTYAYRWGHHPIVINTGGTVDPATGRIVGGTNDEYWFKDNTSASGLVKKGADPFTPIPANQYGTHPALNSEGEFIEYTLKNLGKVYKTPLYTYADNYIFTLPENVTYDRIINVFGQGSTYLTLEVDIAPVAGNTNQFEVTDLGIEVGTQLLVLYNGSGLAAPSTTPPVMTDVYYGVKQDNAVLSAAQITAGTKAQFVDNADIEADFRSNTSPAFLWVAERDNQPVKTRWFARNGNEGNIGGTGDLFKAPAIVTGGWRFYITNYKTQNNETTIILRKP